MYSGRHWHQYKEDDFLNSSFDFSLISCYMCNPCCLKGWKKSNLKQKSSSLYWFIRRLLYVKIFTFRLNPWALNPETKNKTEKFKLFEYFIWSNIHIYFTFIQHSFWRMQLLLFMFEIIAYFFNFYTLINPY